MVNCTKCYYKVLFHQYSQWIVKLLATKWKDDEINYHKEVISFSQCFSNFQRMDIIFFWTFELFCRAKDCEREGGRRGQQMCNLMNLQQMWIWFDESGDNSFVNIVSFFFRIVQFIFRIDFVKIISKFIWRHTFYSYLTGLINS